MEFFKYFFRSKEDGFVLEKFGTTHLIILAFFIIGIILIINKSFGLDEKKTNKRFLKTLAYILLTDQIVLYLWQVFSGYFRFDMSLPLYHCRMAVWLLILGILKEDRIFKIIGLYMGFLGSLTAMLLPDLYQFSFPHYTNFQFFIVHILMGWIVVDFVWVEKILVKKEELKTVLTMLNIFNLFLVIFNLLLKPFYENINYGYVLGMPSSMKEIFPKGIHTIFIFLLFDIVIILIYKLINSINGRKLDAENKKVLE